MRVASLDIIRGVAVLGILAINIAGFAGPSIGTLTPNLPHPAGPWGEAAYFGNVLLEFSSSLYRKSRLSLTRNASKSISNAFGCM